MLPRFDDHEIANNCRDFPAVIKGGTRCCPVIDFHAATGWLECELPLNRDGRCRVHVGYQCDPAMSDDEIWAWRMARFERRESQR